MAFVATSANYGIGRYGSARYGLVDVSHIPTSIVATGTIGTISPNVKEKVVSGVGATTRINTVQVNLKAEPEGIQATFTVNDAGLSVRSINRVPIGGVSSTGAIEAPSAGGFEIDITERVTASIVATVTLNTPQINLIEKVSGVAATGSVNGAFEFSNTHRVTSTGTEFTVGVISPNVNEPIPTAGFFTGFIGTLTLHTAGELTGSEAAGQIGTISTTAEVFDFTAVKDLYSRRRTVLIPRAA